MQCTLDSEDRKKKIAVNDAYPLTVPGGTEDARYHFHIPRKSKKARHLLSVNEKLPLPNSQLQTSINHLYFLFSSRRLSSPAAGAAVIVRALEISGRRGQGLLLVLFPET